LPSASNALYAHYDPTPTIFNAIPSRLQDLSIERRWPKDATNDLLVEIESISDDKGKTLEIHPVGNVANERQSVPVTSSSYSTTQRG